MEIYYALIIGVLFLLAISLLIIGVSNDAVNFLNSAIGSKAAPFTVVLAIAGVGVLLGAVFSNGMMEVARKGIFNPEYFAFSEIIVIFLAVMLTNILLLDFFNTMGLPTSTTISIVFGLMGSAVAVSIYKISAADLPLQTLGNYINIDSSVLIVVGIFLSVVIAFNLGMIIQWIVRLAFSFRIRKAYKYWAALWGGFAITAILFFLLIKGAKGSTLVTPAMLDYIHTHTWEILLISFLGWTLLFLVLTSFTRINILKITVLVGTFALAMAFAGNDLVNFIGVPLAGFESFKIFLNSGGADAGSLMMEALQEPVNTPVYFLVAAGLIMVFTLRFSKKAKSVLATTIDLSRQEEGSERFHSSALARFIVRKSVEFSNGITRYTPEILTRFLENRFNSEQEKLMEEEAIAFDLVRASVNLVVASILIAIGTSFKLPLSTTYVTFMVAMGTSLADGAWGRDSAVYRITGVLTVIGGWFFTAFCAFLVSFLIASLVFFGKFPAIIILLGLAIFILLRTHAFHKRKEAKEEKHHTEIANASQAVLEQCNKEVQTNINRVAEVLGATYTGFFKEKHKDLKKLRKQSRQLSKKMKETREEIPLALKKFEETELVSGHHYVQVVTYMKEMCNSLTHIVQPAYNHLDNNHALDKFQTGEIKDFNKQVLTFLDFALEIISGQNYESLDGLVEQRDILLNEANEILLARIKILKKNNKGVKISATYVEMLTETRGLILNVVQLVKADFKLTESLRTDKE